MRRHRLWNALTPTKIVSSRKLLNQTQAGPEGSGRLGLGLIGGGIRKIRLLRCGIWRFGLGRRLCLSITANLSVLLPAILFYISFSSTSSSELGAGRFIRWINIRADVAQQVDM